MGKKPISNIIKANAWGKGNDKIEIKNPPRPTRIWPVPADLEKDGIEFYKRVGKILFDHDVLNELSRGSFVHLCMLYDRIMRLNRMILKDGEVIDDKRGSMKRHPALIIQQAALSEFRAIAKELGLTPGDTNRLGINLQIKKDAMAEFLFGGMTE